MASRRCMGVPTALRRAARPDGDRTCKPSQGGVLVAGAVGMQVVQTG